MDTLQVEYRKVNLNKTKTGKHERKVGTTRQFVTTETKQIYYENKVYECSLASVCLDQWC